MLGWGCDSGEMGGVERDGGGACADGGCVKMIT